MGKTSIEWADFSVNPIRARNRETGSVGHFCEKISPGCAHCYASSWQHRFTKDGKGTGLDFLPVNRGKVELFLEPKALDEVLRRRKPTKWFWCDMTDLFLDGVPDAWIDKCLTVMGQTPHHTHMILTKRPGRALEYFRGLEAAAAEHAPSTVEGTFTAAQVLSLRELSRFPHFGNPIESAWPLPNVWLGASVEDQKRADERIPLLIECPAAVRFLSAEPLLGPVVPMLGLACGEWYRRIDQVIVGGESGAGARPMHPDWARAIRDQCQSAGVSFFFKQWGEWIQGDAVPGGDLGGDFRRGVADIVTRDREPDGHFRRGDVIMRRVGKKAAGRLLDGREWNELPKAVTHAS